MTEMERRKDVERKWSKREKKAKTRGEIGQ